MEYLQHGARAADADPGALAAAVAELRRRVCAGDPIDVTALSHLAGAVASRRPDRHGLDGRKDMALLALLDEVELLAGELGREHGTLAEQLRTATRHKRAGVAYGDRSAGP